MKHDVVIIGGGPAGLAAAIAVKKGGVDDVVILERDSKLGGILNQCIHNGFGLTRFKESLSGPEYAQRFIDQVESLGIKYYLNTMVLELDQKTVKGVNQELGYFEIQAKSIILCMGCRERSRGALNIPGSRPAGVFSAGTAQKYINILGYMPGKSVVILGSGDIGLIMARRMTLEGAKVHAVCEIMPHSSGLKRNIVQCLDDFGIPLYLNHTITKIHGENRVSGVTISQVDQNRKPISGTEKYFDCDTVLFSVGLIPENELSINAGVKLSKATKGAIVSQTRETNIPGVFACGNVLQVHDLVDFVSLEAEIAGKYSAEYILKGGFDYDNITVSAGDNISYVLPQIINRKIAGDVKLFFRVKSTFNNPTIRVLSGDQVLLERKKKIAVPGEMESLVIKADTIPNLQDIKVELIS